MEYQLKKEMLPICETVVEASNEQPVDLDFSLPDYCPDIERILKCRICPSITSKNISGDRLDVDGVAIIRLYYLDAKKQAIRICEHTSPFSCFFNIKDSSQELIPVVRVRTEYLNCRALTPRRLDIHGAFSVCVSVYKKSYQEFCCNVEGDDIQQKKHSERVSTLCGIGQQQFSVSEVLDIGQGKGLPEGILRSELNVNVRDCRAVSDKLMLKGEAVLRILYITDIETGAQDTMTFNIPLSQVVDVQGITEQTQNEINVDVLSYDVSLKSEYDENSTLVTLDAKLCATVFAYENRDIDIIDDVYSTSYELETTQKQTGIKRLMSITDDIISAQTDVSITDDGISKIIDIWSDSVNFIYVYENSTLTLKGKVNCGIFALNEEGVPFYSERAVEFNASPNVPADLSDVQVRANLVPVLSFRITGNNSIEIKSDISVNAAVFENRSCKTITAVEANEENKRDKDMTAAITLYYADEGESLWSIARHYCTSVEAIRLENDLAEDTVNVKGMILIPM